jgi:hypothetical protein
MLLENFEPVAILIHSPPEIERMTFAMNGEEDLIEVPFVARFGVPAVELIGIRLPKLSTPRAHRFVCQKDAACRHQFFDVPVTEAKAEAQPHAVAAAEPL